MKKMIALLLALMSYGAPALAADSEETALTIYSRAEPGAVDPNLYRPVDGQPVAYFGSAVPGYAIVRQVRQVNIPEKESLLRFSDVAALIDPTTVIFKSLTDPAGTKVAEQDYQFDLVSQQKLLEKYIDRKISIEKTAGDKIEAIDGTLLSTQGGLTLKSADGSIKLINGYSAINFPDLPGGLIARPTLVWDIITGKPGLHKAEVSYETQGITWWADYGLVYHEGKDANTGTVDFSSWVSIINQTGAGYDNARLKLIAGDVQRAEGQGSRVRPMVMAMAKEAAAPAPAFAEKAFFEYHMYTLNRPVSLPDNSTKQLELIPAVANVPVEKLLAFGEGSAPYWGGINTDRNYGLGNAAPKVDVYLKLQNKKENGLGVPLPAGRVRASQRDDDGNLEFIGEDVIGHTPRNEDILIKIGSAFDVVGERRQVSYTLDEARKTAEEEMEVRIRNRKKQAVKVKVLENLYRAGNWTILESDPGFKKENAHQVSFLVDVDPEKEKVIHYRVKYSW